MAGDRYEQMSLFRVDGHGESRCCADGRTVPAEAPEAWMLEIVPQGEHVVTVDGRPLVLSPVPLRSGQVRAGHRYYHYVIGGRVYAGIFVG